MLRVLIIFAVFFGVLANAAHGVAHASGQHSHDIVETGHHPHDHEEATDDETAEAKDARPATPDQKADHAVGHTHVVGDRSSTFDIADRGYAYTGTTYRIGPDTVLPSTLSAPLLEPPSA